MKRSEAKRSEENIYFSGMSELIARIEASVVILKCVYSTVSESRAFIEGPSSYGCYGIREDNGYQQREISIVVIEGTIANFSEGIRDSDRGSIFGEESESMGFGKNSHTRRGREGAD